MNTGICVLGHARPKYLFVTLDSLFRVRGIDNYNVHAFIDGGGVPREQFEWVLNKFNLFSYFIRQENYGMNRHTFDSIKTCFDIYGYDEIIVVEHDDIFSVDFIEYSESLDMEDYFAICLGRACSPMRAEYFTTCGWRISRDNFYKFIDWFHGKYWTDILDPRRVSGNFTEEEAFDGILLAYILTNKKFCHFCTEKHHAGNFGVLGLHSSNNNDRKKYDSLFFTGPISQWIWNVAKLLKEGAYSDSVQLQFFPRGWDGLCDLLEQTQPAYKDVDANMMWGF